MRRQDGLGRFGFSEDDLRRVRSCHELAYLEFHREIASTNDRAIQIIQQEIHRYPLLILAQQQTAGRGRGANRWWSSKGALTFSLVLDAQAMDLPEQVWPQLSLTTGLAICEGVEDVVDCKAQLKWPNDVYLEGRKLAGILIETSGVRQKQLVIGVGMNVNNSVAQLPDVASSAISLSEYGSRVALVDVLLGVLDRLFAHLACIGTGNDQLQSKWQQRCYLTNRYVRIDMASEQIEGICQGIDGNGALLVRSSGRLQRCYAGVVNEISDDLRQG